MEKTVQIDGKPVTLRASAALPRLYRSIVGKDLFADVKKLSRNPDDDESSGLALETIENLAYIMARSADPERKNNIPLSIDEWLDGIDDPSAILSIADDVVELYRANAQTTSIPKKKKGKRKGR